MRLVLISDTHDMHDRLDIPDGDVLIHASDMSNGGEPEEIRDFGEGLAALPHPHKIVNAGNHDFLFQDEPAKAQSLQRGCTCLQDSSVVVDRLCFYGSPYPPRFFDWAFNQDRGPVSAARWALISGNTDVLITQGPPFGIRDPNFLGELTGCRDLLAAIDRVRQKLHVFGHIHEGAGMQVHSTIGTTFVNASMLGPRYDVAFEPIVIDL